MVKRFASTMSKHEGYDAFVLRESFLAQRKVLKHWGRFGAVEHVFKPTKLVLKALQQRFPAANDLECASGVNLGQGGICCNGDAVWLHDRTVAQVWGHYLIDNETYSSISRWSVVHNGWEITQQPEFVRTVAILEPVAYCVAGRIAVVMRPLRT